MELIFLNASPRAKGGNTELMVKNFLQGFMEEEGNAVETLYLVKYRKKLDELCRRLLDAEMVIIGFPLYVDSVPGSLKEFLEAFSRYKNEEKKPALGFFGQCGFPETAHMRPVERYLEKLTAKLKCRYLGSIMKGGGEGQHIQPEPFLQKTFSLLKRLGKDFGETGNLDSELLVKLARPETLNHDQIRGLIPFINKALWDRWLEENGVLEKSFDRPY